MRIVRVTLLALGLPARRAMSGFDGHCRFWGMTDRTRRSSSPQHPGWYPRSFAYAGVWATAVVLGAAAVGSAIAAKKEVASRPLPLFSDCGH